MPPTNAAPQGALPLNSYQELAQVVQAFTAGQLNLLFLLGPPGVQKSRLVQANTNSDTVWIDGNLTAFGFYRELYQHRDRWIVLDDVDGLYQDRAAMRILKCVCQTEPTKRVSWHSDSATLRREQIPRSFTTRSRLVIIANELRTLNVNVRAVQDRGLVVVFQPTPLEIHRRVASWYWDQEVFEFVGANLQRAQQLSMRDYVVGWELKRVRLDWRHWLLAKWGLTGNKLLVTKIKLDPNYQSEDDRLAAFAACGGGAPAIYHHYVEEWERNMETEVPNLQLNGSPPLEVPKPLQLTDILRQRFRNLGHG